MCEKRTLWSQKYNADSCVNCGSTEYLMFHHVVPLGCGGNDIPSNIIVLCSECHGKAHSRNLFTHHGVFGGRPRDQLTTKDVDILNRWANKEIGTAECKRLLGKTDGFRITSSSMWKDALKHNLIKGWDGQRNTIDIKTSQSKRIDSIKAKERNE